MEEQTIPIPPAVCPPIPGLPFYVAHTPTRENPNWHPLIDHILGVAQLAETFAQPFGGSALARYVALLHDLGKFDDGFQKYLYHCWLFEQKKISLKPKTGSAPHKQTGAQVARKANKRFGKRLAQVLFGHHGGMENDSDTSSGETVRAEKMAIRDVNRLVERAKAIHPGIIPPIPPLQELLLPGMESPTNIPAIEMYLRFVFSCLTDADSLDTERHKSPSTATQRQHEAENAPSLTDLHQIFFRDHQKLTERLRENGESETTVNQVRRIVFEDCLAKAVLPPGVFRLTVPTGGGKTRSSLAFALKHAVQYKKRRIIYAAPYTSILDQTADIFEKIFGTDNRIVLEHHSAVEPPEANDETDPANERERWRKLAAENWDAPIIVTTQVQLFESLYSNRPGKCRKLHNIAGSVLILDEVQALPFGLISLLINGLQILATHFNVTIVLCTATQPALDIQLPHFKGFDPVPIEIIREPKAHFDSLRRVVYHVEIPPLDSPTLTERIREDGSCLCVVNIRRQAVQLINALDPERTDETVFHLSTLMCGHHRREVLETIRQRLKDKLPTRLISTTVIEAGVDVDFPRLFRTLAPLPSLIQAAGRCNREGKLCDEHNNPIPGTVTIFQFPPDNDGIPRDEFYRTSREKTQTWLADAIASGQSFDFDDPATITSWFQSVLADLGNLSDAKGILQLIKEFNFRAVAEKVRLIEETTIPVLPVEYTKRFLDYETLFDKAEKRGGLSGKDWRTLQPFCVNIYPNSVQGLEERFPGLYLWQGEYDSKIGLPLLKDPADAIIYRPDSLVVG